MFDYFYGPQAEQFAFYRVPKVLFTNDRFKYLSAEAKTLYGILVTNNMLQTYGITADQLHSDAMEAAVQNHPATLRNMNDVMRDMMGDAAGMFIPDEPSPIWVATVRNLKKA